MKLYISYNLNEVIKELHKHWKHKEWSGLLKVKKIKGAYIAYDIFFPKQRNSSAYTTFTGDINDELIPYLQEKNELHAYSDYAVWIHSHHSMNAFRSGTDYDTRRDFASWGCNEFMSVVTSYKSGTNELDGVFYNCTLDIFKPVDFEYDCEVILGIPDVSQVRTEETEEYKKHKKLLKEFEKYKKELIETYCLPEDAFKEKTFSGQKYQLIFHEPEEYKLNPQEKVNELLAKEEKTQFLSHSYYDHSFLFNTQNSYGNYFNKNNKANKNNKKKSNDKLYNQKKSLYDYDYDYRLASYEPELDKNGELILNTYGFYKTIYNTFEPLSKLDQYFDYIGEPNPFI